MPRAESLDALHKEKKKSTVDIDKWLPSRFNMISKDSSHLFVYNSLSGAFTEFIGEEAVRVATILAGNLSDVSSDLLSILRTQGFVIPRDRNEMAIAKDLHESISTQRGLNLILMPFENCNFRCIYCYEEFKRNRMSRDVIEGILNLVHKESNCGLNSMSFLVRWRTVSSYRHY